jgi:hypothetical protein
MLEPITRIGNMMPAVLDLLLLLTVSLAARLLMLLLKRFSQSGTAVQ